MTVVVLLLASCGFLAASVPIDAHLGEALRTAGYVCFIAGGKLCLFQALIHRDHNYSRGHRDGTRVRRRTDSLLQVVSEDDRRRGHG